MTKATAEALREVLISSNVSDRNLEPANVVDTLGALADAANRIADAICPPVPGNSDAPGGNVESLAEAVTCITDGLFAIANAITTLSTAVDDVATGISIAQRHNRD